MENYKFVKHSENIDKIERLKQLVIWKDIPEKPLGNVEKLFDFNFIKELVIKSFPEDKEVPIYGYYYTKIHIPRFIKTLQLSWKYLENFQSILDCGCKGQFNYILSIFFKFNHFGISLTDDFNEVGRFINLNTNPVSHSQEFIEGENIVHNYGCDVLCNNIPFQDESLDIVFSLEFLEHLFKFPLLYILEVNRILKYGGKLILTTPNSNSIKSIVRAIFRQNPYIGGSFTYSDKYGPGYETHARELSIGEMRLYLYFFGFKIVEHTSLDYNCPGEPPLDPIAQNDVTNLLQNHNREEHLLKEMHFIVGEKHTKPIFPIISPLCDVNDVLVLKEMEDTLFQKLKSFQFDKDFLDHMINN